MSKVISLARVREERAPHLSGGAKCLGCGHEWVAVAPVGTVEMERPACSLPKGRFVALVAAGDKAWHCNCGNDLFRINEHAHVYCACCGTIQEGWFQ